MPAYSPTDETLRTLLVVDLDDEMTEDAVVERVSEKSVLLAVAIYQGQERSTLFLGVEREIHVNATHFKTLVSRSHIHGRLDIHIIFIGVIHVQPIEDKI
jgi:hypothetical protein